MKSSSSGKAGRQVRASGLWYSVAGHWQLYLMLILPIIYIILFKYQPMYGAQIAFRRFTPIKGITGSKWIGLDNFVKFFSSPMFSRLLKNTILLSLFNMLASFPFSVTLAIGLNYVRNIRYKKTVQMISYAPHFISTVVMASLILQFLSARGGLLNEVLGIFGIPAVNYMAYPEYFYSVYVWSGVWQEMGYGAIIYISALSGVSSELHEAAIVDGANIVKRIWHVDIPSILPTFCILLIMRCGSLLNIGFEKVLLLQNNINTSVAEVISTFVYRQGIAASRPQYSFAAAIGLFQSIFNMIMLLTVNTITGKLTGNSMF